VYLRFPRVSHPGPVSTPSDRSWTRLGGSGIGALQRVLGVDSSHPEAMGAAALLPVVPPSAASGAEARHRQEGLPRAAAPFRHRPEGLSVGAAPLRSRRGAAPRERASARAGTSGGAAAARASAQGPGLAVGRRPYCTVLIVPTGVGAAVGGCAGDALPVARAFAEGADCLVTHPNVRGRAPATPHALDT